MTRKLLCLLLLLAFLLVGCAAPVVETAVSAVGEKSTSWPTAAWRVSTPEEEGMDPAMLEHMVAEIERTGLQLDSALVIRNGAIVSETYFNGQKADSLHTMYSVTKSFTATLLGIAMDQGKLDGVERKVSEVLPGRDYANPDPRKADMTVEDLLTMRSGLGWQEGDPAYRAMYMSRDWVQWVMDLPMERDPGEKFNYCSGCTHVLSAILQEQVGMSAEAFGRKHLFGPLGIKNLRWEADAQGISIGGWGLNITARDMAKLGYLYLHNGEWDGKQVLSAEWVKAATTKRAEGGGRLDYAYQWWIDEQNDAFAATGRDGQLIYVHPETGIIVVFTARGVDHDVELAIIDTYVLPAVR